MAVIEPAKRKLKLYENETKNVIWRLEDSHKNPIDLTGWSGRAQIVDSDGVDVLTIYSTGSDAPVYIEIDGEKGKVTLTFNPVLETYAGFYDMFLIDPDDKWHKLVLESSISVAPARTTLE